MLFLRRVLLPLAFLTPLSAYGSDFLKESFNGKTPGTALAGQAVEFALEPQFWSDFSEVTAASTQWTVTDASAFGGANSVRVDSAGKGSSNLDAMASGAYPPFDPFQPIYRLTGALNVASGGSNVGYGIGLVSNKFLGGLYILDDGSVVILAGSGGGGHAALSAPGVPLVVGLDGWHSLEARFDFSDEHNATSTYFLDGSALSVDGIGPASFALTTTQPPRSIYMESVSADGLNPMSGHAHFDSLNLETVPEPACMAALGLGIVGLLRRRRSIVA